jgi:hypothetical protein
MIEVAARTAGHSENKAVCGAISMLMRGYGLLAACYASRWGENILIMDPRDALDYEALCCGLTAILAAHPEEVKLVVDGTEQAQLL